VCQGECGRPHQLFVGVGELEFGGQLPIDINLRS
jgi:hypothetical protein